MSLGVVSAAGAVTVDSATVTNFVVGLAAFVAALGVIYVATIRPAKRGWDMIHLIYEDWVGRPGRPGFPRVPGIAERLETIETASETRFGRIEASMRDLASIVLAIQAQQRQDGERDDRRDAMHQGGTPIPATAFHASSRAPEIEARRTGAHHAYRTYDGGQDE